MFGEFMVDLQEKNKFSEKNPRSSTLNKNDDIGGSHISVM